MSGRTESRVDMTTGRIWPKLVALSWPLVVGNLLQTLYNLADMFWVGRVSPEAVAAVSLMFPTAWMFISTAMGITAATVALVSQHVGAGNERQADRVVGQTALLSTVVAVAIAALGYAFREPLVWLIGARGQVYADALAYIEVIFLALPFTFLFFAFRASLRGAGDTRTAMWLVAVSAGINIVIDPFFILGWGPFPAMGTRGAAVATLLSRGLAALAGVYVLVRGDFGIRLRLTDLRPDWAIQRQLVSIGAPAVVDGWARSFAAVVMAAFVARFGAAPTAAYGVGIRLMSVSWTVSGAVGQATATGVGQNLGADIPDRAAEVTWKATGATMGVLFAATALVLAFPDVAIRIFIDDAEVIAEGVGFLRIVAPAWAFFGGLMVIQGAFRGAGRTTAAMVLSLLSRWIVRVPVAVVLAFSWTVTVPGIGVDVGGLGIGVEGIWWGFAIGAYASFFLGVLWFKAGDWQDAVVEGRRAPGTPEADAAGDLGDGDD